jgi:alkylation response protein AidB-like acyl-CoA dehydrogenase
VKSTRTCCRGLVDAVESGEDQDMHAPFGDRSPEDIATEVEIWLKEHWDPAMSRREWQSVVIDAGYAAPTWSTERFGRNATGDQAKAVAAAFAHAGAKGTGHDRHNLWANTLLAFGAPELQDRMLRPLVMDDMAMCLLYSEPGAGSDLAGLQTRADRDGDEWIINGQKVWTSGAKTAEYGMLIARTDWGVPKHQGISFFWFPMRQAGVEIRPIRQITDEAHFNEVFLTNARVPHANMLGAPGEGWRVLQTALAYERSVMGDVARGPRQPGTGERPAEGKARSEAAAAPPVSAVEIDLWELARKHGCAEDPIIRQAIAKVHSWRKVNAWNAARAKADLAQGTSSPILSLGKLAMSRILHEGARVHGKIVGAQTMLAGSEFADANDANFLALNAYFTSIGGGTDQIQRNIIGERVLGLPKEPEPDRALPFDQVRKASVAR